MAGIKKFNSLEEACKALGVTKVTDANRAVLEGLVKKSQEASESDTRKELYALAEEVGLELDKARETVKSIKILIALKMKELDHEKLAEFLEEQGWAFSEYDDKLYALKRKATPIAERKLPEQGTVGYEVMRMVGLEEFKKMEFEEFLPILKQQGFETTEKTIAFYDNFASHRIDDCAAAFGEGWSYLRRPSVILKDFGDRLDLEEARLRRPGKKKKVEGAEPAGEPAGEPAEATGEAA